MAIRCEICGETIPDSPKNILEKNGYGLALLQNPIKKVIYFCPAHTAKERVKCISEIVPWKKQVVSSMNRGEVYREIAARARGIDILLATRGEELNELELSQIHTACLTLAMKPLELIVKLRKRE